jgi:hypothetical protein
MDGGTWQGSKKEMGVQIMAYTPKAKRGLYFNINQRRAAGLPPKRPGMAGYPTKEAFIKSKRTAKR